MYARMTYVPYKPGTEDEFTRIFNDSVMQDVKHVAGNTAVYLLLDREHNQAITMTLWVSHEDGEKYEASGSYQQQVAKLVQYITGPTELRKFDVALWG